MSKHSYSGHKSEWNRDKGVKPGHPREDGMATHQHSQPHTHFEARGWHEDKGSNTRLESIHTGKTNRNKHNPDAPGPNRSHSSHDPRPSAWHSNSGTSSEGHRLIRRGASKFPVG